MKTRMPAEMGEVIVKALEMAMDGDAQRDAPIAARRADALAEVAETFLSCMLATAKMPTLRTAHTFPLKRRNESPATVVRQRSKTTSLANH